MRMTDSIINEFKEYLIDNDKSEFVLLKIKLRFILKILQILLCKYMTLFARCFKENDWINAVSRQKVFKICIKALK